MLDERASTRGPSTKLPRFVISIGISVGASSMGNGTGPRTGGLGGMTSVSSVRSGWGTKGAKMELSTGAGVGTVGTSVGDAESTVGDSVNGASVGLKVGDKVGVLVGFVVGNSVGFWVGLRVGSAVGFLVGSAVGFLVGFVEGAGVGLLVGFAEGSAVGFLVGSAVGKGDTVGSSVVLALLDSKVSAKMQKSIIRRRRDENMLLEICYQIGIACWRQRLISEVCLFRCRKANFLVL